MVYSAEGKDEIIIEVMFGVNPFTRVEKWPNILKKILRCHTASFKCVWPFANIAYERVNSFESLHNYHILTIPPK